MDRRSFIRFTSAAILAALCPLVRWAQQKQEIEVYDDLGFGPRDGARGLVQYNARNGRWHVIHVEC